MNPKINAAKRLATALNDPMDFAMYLMDHPNTERAMERLLSDIAGTFSETHNGKGNDDGHHGNQNPNTDCGE